MRPPWAGGDRDRGRGRGRGGRRRWRSTRRLQTRLFLWFVLAILIAFGANSAAFWVHQASDQTPPAPHVLAGTVGARVARTWDDPEATTRYLAQVREVTGLDLRLRRDLNALGSKRTLRNGFVSFDGHGNGLIPVQREGTLVGALEFDAGHGPPRHASVLFGLVAALVVLGVGARAVSRRLAWPLEDVADAAERFGAGDLSARTHLGKARHFVAEEVNEVAHAFDQMATRIERVVRDQRELLAAISHELRSPLGRARVALEIARDRSPMPALDEIEHQLADVDAILGDLLAAARAGLSDAKLQPTQVLPWLRARLASEPPSPVIELTTEDGADLFVPLDASLMNRALHNLIANASAHGHPPGEPIEVRLVREGERVVVTVRDRGPGFTPELLPRAFDPFVKGDDARTPGSGYGLGLALVRRIADAHGGRAFARNAPPDIVGRPGGAEVGIELPVVEAAEPPSTPRKID